MDKIEVLDMIQKTLGIVAAVVTGAWLITAGIPAVVDHVEYKRMMTECAYDVGQGKVLTQFSDVVRDACMKWKGW